MNNNNKHTSLPVSSNQILKGISMPQKCRALKYPFAEMEVGESIFSVKNLSSVSSSYTKRNPPKKFAVRPYNLDGTQGFMCWRIK